MRPGPFAVVGSASWEQPDADRAAGIRAVVADAAERDGIPAVSGHVLDAIDEGAAGCLMAPADGVSGALAGVAVAVSADPAEVVVRPEYRRKGLGAALVRAAIDRQAAVWAYGDLPAAAAVADRLGLVRGRVLLQMRRTVAGTRPQGAPETVPDLPSGVQIRTFVPGQDEDAFLGVNARAFAWHPEQGRLDLDGLRAEMAQSWFDPAGFFLAVTADDRVVGFHWTKVHAADPTPGPGEPAGPIGEVYVLGVDPEAGIRGLGTPLTAVGLDHLHEAGLQTVMLYVEGDNDRARRLYERFGFDTYLTNVVYARPAPTTR